MARKRKPIIKTAGELLEMAQKAETDVIYERTQLQIEELRQRHHVRKAVLDRLTSSAGVTVQDILEKKAGAPDKVQLRDLTKVPEHVARAVKRVKVTTHTDKAGGTTQTVEVELAHHLAYDELIGKHLNMFANQPAQVNVNIHNQPTEKGAPAPANLAELPLDQVREHRARLEKEVQALDVRDTEEEA